MVADVKVTRDRRYWIEWDDNEKPGRLVWSGDVVRRRKSREDIEEQCRRILSRVPSKDLWKPRYAKIHRIWVGR